MKRPRAAGDDPDGSDAESGSSAGSDADDEEAPTARGVGEGRGRGRGRGGRKRSHVVLSDGRIVSSKVRNHVNPLLPHFQKPVPGPADGDWGKVFRDPAQPCFLDLGCAKGRFCLEGAKRWPEFNWLGIEIREPLVVRANDWVKEHKLSNLHFIFGNASAGLLNVLTSLPKGVLRRVSVQCPDPLFKKKHQKRRMVTDRLVGELADHMPEGGVIFVQSDVEQVAMQMVDTIAVSGRFTRTERLPEAGSLEVFAAPVAPIKRPANMRGGDFQDRDIAGGAWEHKGSGAVDGAYAWLTENPIGLMSERESSTISRGLPMFRALFQRNAQAEDGGSDGITEVKPTTEEGGGGGSEEPPPPKTAEEGEVKVVES